MRAAPPARRIGRISAVRRPGVGLVRIEAVERADVLGEADRLEDAHVLPAGKNVAARKLRIELRDRAHHVLLLVLLRSGEHRAQGGDEVSPDHRLVRNGRNLARGNPLCADDFKALAQNPLADAAAILAVKEDVQGILIPMLRIDAVCREPSAEPVGAVMHRRNSADDDIAWDHAPLLGDECGNRTACGDPDRSFPFHIQQPFLKTIPII